MRHRRRAAFVAARAGRRDQRYRLAAAAHNLARIMRLLFGIGKPRVLQAPAACLACAVYRHGFLADDEHRGEPIDGRRPWLVRVGDALTNPRPEAVT